MSYDKSWAEKLGVDTSKLIVSQARTINDMVEIGVDLMQAGVDLVVVGCTVKGLCVCWDGYIDGVSRTAEHAY